MKGVLKFLRALVLDNIGWKLLSLITAVMIWALVASEPELTTMATVHLEYKNLPDDLELSFVGEPVGAISLELRGSSLEIRNLGDGGVRAAVVLDMTGMQSGERTFPIGPQNVRLPRGVEFVRAIPSQVRLQFEPRMTRSVPVTVRFAHEGENGYVVGQANAEPHQLAIVGPASHVSRVNAVTTDPVDVSRATGVAEFHVNAFIEDPYVRFESSPQVTVAVTMKKQ